MHENFTILFLSQHYPVSQQLDILSHEDISIDRDVADLLQTAERQVIQPVLDRVYSFASAMVQSVKVF